MTPPTSLLRQATTAQAPRAGSVGREIEGAYDPIAHDAQGRVFEALALEIGARAWFEMACEMADAEIAITRRLTPSR